MDLKALYNLTYGMYIVATEFEGKMNGQIANVSGQVTDKPIRLFVCLNNQNLTTELIKKRKAFTISILSEEADMKLIGKFGFKSGKEINKFDETTEYILTEDNLPVVKNSSIAYMIVDVESELNLGSHTMFIGKLRDCNIIKEGKPMTYAYYHLVKGGLTQKNAPTYIEDKIKEEEKDKKTQSMKKYKCTVCGYVYDPTKGDPDSGIKPGTPFEEIPDDWKCPICGVGKNMFEVIE